MHNLTVGLVYLGVMASLLASLGVSVVTGWFLPVVREEILLRLVGIPLILSGLGMLSGVTIFLYSGGSIARYVTYGSAFLLVPTMVYAVIVMLWTGGDATTS